jgi:hypothetical protein
MILDISAAKAKAFDPFDPKPVEASTKVPVLAIRRPGDPPPTLTDRQRAIALLRWCAPWIGPVRHHGHVAPPFAFLPWRRGPRPTA